MCLCPYRVALQHVIHFVHPRTHDTSQWSFLALTPVIFKTIHSFIHSLQAQADQTAQLRHLQQDLHVKLGLKMGQIEPGPSHSSIANVGEMVLLPRYAACTCCNWCESCVSQHVWRLVMAQGMAGHSF